MPPLTVRTGLVVVVLVLAVLMALSVLPMSPIVVGGLIGLLAVALLT